MLDNTHKWVYFDFFDTLFHRIYSEENMKKKWSKIISRKFQYQISPDQLYQIRKDAEKQLSQGINGYSEYTYTELVNSIIGRMQYCTNSRYNFNDFYETCFYTELELQTRNLYLDNQAAELIEKLHASSVKMAIISDYYLPKAFYIHVLETFHLNQYFKEIFISCEFHCNKYSGELYQYLIDTNKICKNAIMIGDNKHSDYYMPQKYGIKAYYKKWKPKENDEVYGKYEHEIHRILKSKNFTYYSASLLLFTEKLYMELCKRNLREVFFCAREGKFLKLLFDSYQEIIINECSPKIKTHYLYISRKASFLISLDVIEQEHFDSFISNYPNCNINNFLKSIGFQPSQIDLLKESLNLSFEEEIKDFINSDSFYLLSKNTLFQDLYESNRINQQKSFDMYFKQFQSTEKRIAMVDIGWYGSIQDNLQKYFKNTKEITGFYVGLLTKKTEVNYNQNKIGLLFSELPYKNKNYKLWSYNYLLYERLFTADHGGTEGYHDGTPVLAEKDLPEEMEQMVQAIQKDIYTAFKSLLQLFQESTISAYEYEHILLKEYCSNMFQISKHDLMVQKKLYESFYDNFGRYIYLKDENKLVKAGIKRFFSKIIFYLNPVLWDENFMYQLLCLYQSGQISLNICFIATKFLYYKVKRSWKIEKMSDL